MVDRKYNNYLCDFYISKDKLEQKIDQSTKSFLDEFEKLKKIHHQRNAMVIKEYPVDQVKDKIRILDEWRVFFEKIEATINR